MSNDAAEDRISCEDCIGATSTGESPSEVVVDQDPGSESVDDEPARTLRVVGVGVTAKLMKPPCDV